MIHLQWETTVSPDEDAASPAGDAVSPTGDLLASPNFWMCDTTLKSGVFTGGRYCSYTNTGQRYRYITGPFPRHHLRSRSTADYFCL
jgi:hypothetical protein